MGKKNKNTRNGRTGAKNKTFKKTLYLDRRAKDLDQIQDEMKTVDTTKMPINEDLPGLGQYTCLSCARYFTSAAILLLHKETRPHKRKLKLALEKPYSQAEADAAAGLGPST